MQKHFPDKDKLITPIVPLETNTDIAKMEELFNGKTFKEDYKILNREVRALKLSIPPLINAYMSLSPTMRTFGTSINDEFGNVEETGILIEEDEILEDKRIRHIESYLKSLPTKRLMNNLANLIKVNTGKRK